MAEDNLKGLVRLFIEELKNSGERSVLTSISADLRGQGQQTKKAVPIPINEDALGIPVALSPAGDRIIFLASKLLGTGSTTVFTAIDPYTDVGIWVCNVDAAVTRTFELHHVPTGGSLADANCFSGVAHTLRLGDTRLFRGFGLFAGDSIRGLCSSANKVNVMVYGVPVIK